MSATTSQGIAESKGEVIDLSLLAETTPDSDDPAFKDFVLADKYLNCVKRPSSLIVSATTLAALHGFEVSELSSSSISTPDQVSVPPVEDAVEVKLVPRDEALKVMSKFAQGQIVVTTVNGHHRYVDGLSVTLCRHCFGINTPRAGNEYHYCTKCHHSHCEKCNDKICNTDNIDEAFAELDLDQYEKDLIKYCHSMHSDSWEKRTVKAQLGPKFKYVFAHHKCNGCDTRLDEDSVVHFNLARNVSYCANCIEQDPDLIDVENLVRYNSLMTASDCAAKEPDLLPSTEKWEKEDRVGSLLNWVPVLQQDETIVIDDDDDDYEANPNGDLGNGAEGDQQGFGYASGGADGLSDGASGGADGLSDDASGGAEDIVFTNHHLLAVNCNPDSPLYNRLCIFQHSQIYYECFPLGDIALVDVLLEVKRLGGLIGYLTRDIYKNADGRQEVGMRATTQLSY